MASSADRLYELAYDALAQQRGTLDGLRVAVTPVSAAAVAVGAVLGKSAFDTSGVWVTRCAWLGVAGAVGILVCIVLLLGGSWDGLEFSFEADQLHKDLESSLGDSEKFQLALAGYLSQVQRDNLSGMRWVRGVFAAMLAFFVLELVGFALGAALGLPDRCSPNRGTCVDRAPSGLRVSRVHVGTAGAIELVGLIDPHARGNLEVTVIFGRGRRAHRTALGIPVVGGHFSVSVRPRRRASRGACHVSYRIVYAGSAQLSPGSVAGRGAVPCRGAVQIATSSS